MQPISDLSLNSDTVDRVRDVMTSCWDGPLDTAHHLETNSDLVTSSMLEVVGCETVSYAGSSEVDRVPLLVTQDDEVDSTVSDDVFARPMHVVLPMQRAPLENPAFVSSTRPRLTLSAFRRPEHTIRLTDSDPLRRLEAEYDLHSPACGVLGHGAFSTVRLAIRRNDGVKVAVKSIAKHDALRSRRLRPRGERQLEEWEILGRLKDHPFVINLLGVFETDEEIQLVMEYCAGGELFDAIQKKRNRSHSLRRGQYSEPQAATITTQILCALKDLHAADMVHRDVKPENVLLANNDDSTIHVKLCDFGMARSIFRTEAADSLDGEGNASPLTPGRSRAYSCLGSDYYVAPEVCYGTAYDTAVDIYSLGVTVYILLCGFPPVFSGSETDAKVMFPNSYWKDISESAKELVRRMLNPDPASRISARDALCHEWISDRGALVAETNSRHVNLDLVRSRLYNSLAANKAAGVAPKKRPAHGRSTTVRKRNNARAVKSSTRASSALMALADLYRDVTKSTAVIAEAKEASKETHCLEKELEDGEREPSFGSLTPLSV